MRETKTHSVFYRKAVIQIEILKNKFGDETVETCKQLQDPPNSSIKPVKDLSKELREAILLNHEYNYKKQAMQKPEIQDDKTVASNVTNSDYGSCGGGSTGGPGGSGNGPGGPGGPGNGPGGPRGSGGGSGGGAGGGSGGGGGSPGGGNGNSNNRNDRRIDAKKPKMGGLIKTYYGKEAWTGGEPKADWSGLADPNAVIIPLPMQG